MCLWKWKLRHTFMLDAEPGLELKSSTPSSRFFPLQEGNFLGSLRYASERVWLGPLDLRLSLVHPTLLKTKRNAWPVSWMVFHEVKCCSGFRRLRSYSNSLGKEQFSHSSFLQSRRLFCGENVQCFLGPPDRTAIVYFPWLHLCSWTSKRNSGGE